MPPIVKILAQKREGEPLEYDEQKILDETKDSKPGCYEIHVIRAKKHKSQNQLGAHFGLLIDKTIIQANDLGIDTSSFLKELVREDLPSGVGLTTNFIKEVLYCVCPMYDDDGKRVTLSKANTEQASKHLEDCRNILAAKHGIYIPKPDKDWRENERKPKSLL